MTWAADHWLDLVGTVLVAAAAWPANGIWYTLGSVPWRDTEMGKVLFSKAMMIALVLDFTLLASLLRLTGWGRPTWFEALRLVLFLGVTITLWWQRDVFRRTAAAPLDEKEPS
jgi:hypothetical protein